MDSIKSKSSELSETRSCFIDIAFQLCFRIWHHEGKENSNGRAHLGHLDTYGMNVFEQNL